MASKYDIYSKLIKLGASKYSVVPEYGVAINSKRIKAIDLVWASTHEDGTYTPEYCFEIEGANVPIETDKGLRRHINDFSSPKFDNTKNVLILYTKGDGIRKWDEKNYSTQVQRRRDWAEKNNARFEVWTYDDLDMNL